MKQILFIFMFLVVAIAVHAVDICVNDTDCTSECTGNVLKSNGSCNDNLCSYATLDCSSLSGLYETDPPVVFWSPDGSCTESESIWSIFLEYTCGDSECVSSATGANASEPTGNVRNLADGTACVGMDGTCQEGVCVANVCTDDDGDGYGTNNSTLCSKVGIDCNDNNGSIHPGATETCNNIDDDCDNQIDEGGVCNICTPDQNQTQNCGSDVGECDFGIQTRTCNTDGQWDTWGACLADVGPTAEICDDKDNDCDGTIDESLFQNCVLGNCNGTQTCSAGNWGSCLNPICSSNLTCIDSDKDGYGANTPNNCTSSSKDCNDNSAGIHPGATDIAGNGIDEDCSGADAKKSGGGGGGSSKKKPVVNTTKACVEDWACTKWTDCSYLGLQYRECTDKNNCSSTVKKPEIMQQCVPQETVERRAEEIPAVIVTKPVIPVVNVSSANRTGLQGITGLAAGDDNMFANRTDLLLTIGAFCLLGGAIILVKALKK